MVHLKAPRGVRQVTSNVPIRRSRLEHTALFLILGCKGKKAICDWLKQPQKSPKFKFSVSVKKNVRLFGVMTKTLILSDKNVPFPDIGSIMVCVTLRLFTETSTSTVSPCSLVTFLKTLLLTFSWTIPGLLLKSLRKISLEAN